MKKGVAAGMKKEICVLGPNEGRGRFLHGKKGDEEGEKNVGGC